jgi:hypothetical protein
MGLFDKVKDMIPEDKDARTDKAQDLAGKLDDKAEDLAEKDGKLGDLAEKAHDVLDKVDKDANTSK